METRSLEVLLQRCWDLLEEGAATAASPLHTPVLGTVLAGSPRLRTVVLRRVDSGSRRLFCHTDLRSEKVDQLGRSEAIAWLFYDPLRKVQLRLQGIGNVTATGELAERQWRGSSPGSRRCYLADPGPGAILPGPVSTLPQSLRDRRPTAEETTDGRANFAVVSTEIDHIDWLWLNSSGHRRARFRWKGGVWESQWIAP